MWLFCETANTNDYFISFDRMLATAVPPRIGQWKLIPSLSFILSFTVRVRAITRQALRRPKTSSRYLSDGNYHILWRNVLESNILMQRELSTFPLAPNCLHKLSIAGYINVDDLKDVSPTELSEGKYCKLTVDWFGFFVFTSSVQHLSSKKTRAVKRE